MNASASDCHYLGFIQAQTLFIHLFSFAYRYHCEYAKFNLEVDNAYGITHEGLLQFNQVKSTA